MIELYHLELQQFNERAIHEDGHGTKEPYRW
jgi:hypothetical protein